MFLVSRTPVGIIMPRLITFGCSFTYGLGLPDCIDTGTEWSSPSNFAWPNLLANKLNYQLKNESYPGSSNLEILYRILNFKFEQDDVVVIMWTVPPRDMYFQPFGKLYRRLGIWMRDRFAKKWILSINDQDYTQRTWIYIHHADLYLKNLKVKYLHCPAYSYDDKPDYLNIENFYHNSIVEIDKALDNAHPGIASHEQISKKIFNYIYEQQ